MLHPARIPIPDLLADCEIQRTRRCGPGGQHRNKVETAVVIEHKPSGIRGEGSERRSQDQNRQVAIHRLRVKLALELRTPEPQGVSTLWQARTVGGEISVNSEHEDFPALLSEALDAIAKVTFDLNAAAEELGVTSSQLVKFLKKEPMAFALVNRERQLRGEKAYR